MGPSIEQCIEAAGAEGLPMEVIQMIVRQIISHLVYIHAQRQLHRDINSFNVRLDLTTAMPPTDAESIDVTGRSIIP